MPTKNIITGQKVTEDKAQRAKELRQNMTPAERQLWQQLRANRLDDWHFRRQQIIAGFIVDFYCHRAGLAVEVDGPIHEDQPGADAERDTILRAHGLILLRFTNRQVMNNMPAVLREIKAALETSKSSLQLSPDSGQEVNKLPSPWRRLRASAEGVGGGVEEEGCDA